MPTIDKDPRFTNLVRAVNSCWQSIGNDIYECAAECGESVTNEQAVESCLDADRLLMYPGGTSGKEANEFVKELCDAGKYSALNKAVRKACRLA